MERRRKVVSDGKPSGKVEAAPKVKKPSKREKSAKKTKNEPEWMEGEGKSVVQLILLTQKSECNTAKNLTELTKLYNRVNFIRLDVFVVLCNADHFASILDGSRCIHGCIS